jgi:SET domain-containing protein
MSLSQVAKYGESSLKSYVFHLLLGPDVMSNFVVYPKDYASAGFFMNHTSSKSKKRNVKTMVVIGKMGPIVFMQAIKKIEYGDELLYDYNG